MIPHPSLFYKETGVWVSGMGTNLRGVPVFGRFALGDTRIFWLGFASSTSATIWFMMERKFMFAIVDLDFLLAPFSPRR